MWKQDDACYDVIMATLSLDLRQRIVSAYDQGEGTQEQIGVLSKTKR